MLKSTFVCQAAAKPLLNEENVMKINFRVVIALLIVVGVAYWAFDSVRQQTHSGTDFSFPMGGGAVVVNNTGQEPAQARLTSTGTRGLFTVNSTVLDAPVNATREGSGANTVYAVDLELPPGTSEVSLNRGSNVTMTINADNPVEVVVNPQSESGMTTTLIAAAVVILGALFYASSTTQHAWLRGLRSRGATPKAHADEGMVSAS